MSGFVTVTGLVGAFLCSWTIAATLATFWPSNHMPSYTFSFMTILLGLVGGFLVFAALATVIEGGSR